MSSKPKSQRQLQASQLIKKILADIFMKEGYSQIKGSYITILEADISPDFKNCKIFIDILGDENKNREIVNKLNEMTKIFRHEISKKLAMRKSPELKFCLDETMKNALNISDLIEQESKKFN